MASGENQWRNELEPVMVELGFALHACQALEHSLCLVLSLASEHRMPSEGQEFKVSWDFHSSKTLGRLVHILQQEIPIPDKLGTFLKEGVEARNQIVHRFITMAGMRLLSPNGRLEVIKEIKELRQRVRDCDKALEPIIDTLLKKYQISTEILKERADSIWKLEHYEANRNSNTRH